MAEISHLIAYALGCIFISSSILKLLASDFEMCRFMEAEFHRFAPVCPLRYVGYNIDPDFYRSLVGITELATGTLLAFGRRPWMRIAAIILTVIMIGGAYTHVAVNEASQAIIPGVFAALLLFILSRN